MKEYFGVAKEMGLSSAEIEAVQSIVMAVSGGRVRAQFRDARTEAARQRRDTG
jgi:hypothetical protein